jgi:hypothetical protein
LAWAGSIGEDYTTEVLRKVIDATTVQEFFAYIDSKEAFDSIS